MTAEEVQPGAKAAERLEALERFVVENDDLLALEPLIGRFNIFDALGIARAEIRHSNFLAFILDPAESHGQGQLFLNAVLMDLLKKAPPESRPLSPIDLDGTDLRGVEVKREWKHTDLLIKCQTPPFVVVIENKIGSQEGPAQLIRYQQTIKEHYPDVRALYVYLTPDLDEPSEEAWVPYSYTDIHRVLARVEKTYRNAIGEDVRVFLDHYLTLIGTRFMDNPQIDKLCQQIYKNHRQALDLIFERVGSPAAGMLAEVANALEEDTRWHKFSHSRTHIDFVPKAWLEWLPPLGIKEDPRSWIMVRLGLNEGKLWYAVEVGPMGDVPKRREIVTTLLAESAGFGLKRSKAREMKDRRSRISSSERILEWSEDDEPELETIRVAVKKTLDELYPKLEGVPLVLKPLLKRLASPT